jgi:hypothetical protein
MKLVIYLTFYFFPFTVLGQVNHNTDSFKSNKPLSKFTLALSMLNHAEWLMEGQTTYTLTESEIKITNTGFGAKKSKVIFSKKITPANKFNNAIIKLGLDSLEDYYTNWCVMTTSGNEYFLNFTTDNRTKKISLHHYYLKQLDEVVQILNSLVPTKFLFSYLSKDQKQECRP